MRILRESFVVSRHPLTRELLGDLLLLRCGTRVTAGFSTLDECAQRLDCAELVVCDTEGVAADALDSFITRAEAGSPPVRVVCVGRSSTADGIAGEVLSSLGRAQSPHERLTPHETDVLLAVAAGLRNADIARGMRRSPKTVEKHRANLQRKLGLRSVAQLTAYAMRNGLLDANAIFATRPGPAPTPRRIRKESDV